MANNVFENKMREVEDNIAPGDWKITERGVYRDVPIYKKGEIVDYKTETASPIPLFPSAILLNSDTQTEKLEITYMKYSKWHSVVVDRATTANRAKIIDLANRGVEVNSDNAGMLVRYIADVVSGSLFCLPRKTAKSVMGWIGGTFMPYTDNIVFDGAEQFDVLYRSLRSRGKLSDWVEFVRPLRAKKEVRLLLAASFASPLIELIGENSFVFNLWGTSGTAKAQPLSTKIVTPDGYTTMGNIRVGDKVIGCDGKPHRVKGVFPQGKKEVYELTFSDGTKTKCCKDHLWKVTTHTRRCHKRGYTVLSLEEMMQRPIKTNGGYQYRVPVNKPVEYRASEPLPISPYLLGALIGDGCLTLKKNPANGGTTLYFNNSENDIISRVTKELNRIGARMWRNKYTVNQFAITGCARLKQAIIELGLKTKSSERFIPDVYKRASINDRRQLLSGLIDTDGCIKRSGSTSYSTKSSQLAEDICELSRSLGYRATKRKDNRGLFEITIITNDKVFSSEKHARRHEVFKAGRSRQVDSESLILVDVQPCGEEECQCILVDSSEHTYLCDDFIVTHNTVALLLASSIWGDPAMGKMTRTMNMTTNSMLSTAAFLRNLPFCGDELQTIKSAWQNYDKLIMCITEGIDRGRMSYDKVNETKSWKCAFLFTGEEPCTKQSSGGGVKNRVIEIELKDQLIEDGNAAANFARSNYGTAGRAFIEYLQTMVKGDTSDTLPATPVIRNVYKRCFEQILDATDTTDKQAGAMAMMLTADMIASEIFWKGEPRLTVDDVTEYLCSAADADVAERAYQFVVNAIAENVENFGGNAVQCWGKLSWKYACINANVLHRIMNAEGFDFDAVKARWADKGYLLKDKNGKYSRGTYVSGARPRCVWLLFDIAGEADSPE